MKYSPALHSLRGFAAIWVMLLHVWYLSGAEDFWFTPFCKLGWIGVHLFYALSAFLLGSIYFHQMQKGNWSIKTFYKKRFLRIFPAYYAQLVIIIALAFYGVYEIPDTKKILAHIILYFNLPPFYQTPINGVWWTLPIEFAFYIILPILMVILKKIKVILFFLLGLLTTISYRYYISHLSIESNTGVSATVIGQLPGVFIVFVLGLVAAYLINVKNIKIPHRILLPLSIVSFIIWSKILLGSNDYWTGSNLLLYWESINALIIVSFIVCLYKTSSVLITNPIFVWFGKVSYGIYLWHFPLIKLLKNNVDGFTMLLITVFPLTLICAALSYYLIEKRFSKV